MTREQAYKLISDSQAGKKITAYDIAPSVFCDYLEALGLLKFADKEIEKSNGRC